MTPKTIPPGDLGNWNDDDIRRFEMAQDILRMMVAAYSGRIADAEPDEAESLREQRTRYAKELRGLEGRDTANQERIINEYPALLRQVRDAR